MARLMARASRNVTPQPRPGPGPGTPRARARARPATVPPYSERRRGSMTSADVSSRRATETPRPGTVDMALEVVTIPVSDVDRAKRFYEGLGWRLDADIVAGELHVVQVTPPHSQCSIHFGTGLTAAAPGSAERM